MSYTSKPQQRLMNAINAMAGHEACGIKSGELAEAIGIQPAQATAVLDNLKTAGWAEGHPRNKDAWRLTAHFSQMANTIALNLQTARQHLELDGQNYSKLS